MNKKTYEANEDSANEYTPERVSLLRDPTMIPIAVVGLGIIGAILYPSFQPPPPPPVAQEVGVVLEEWSVEHPHLTLIETPQFVSYSSYVAGLSPGEEFQPLNEFANKSDDMKIKVINKENAKGIIGFEVCAYTVNGISAKDQREGMESTYSFDSTTGEVISQDAEECS